MVSLFSQPFGSSSSSSPSLPLRKCNTLKLKPFTVFSSSQQPFPPFLPKEIHSIKDPFARKFAMRIQRLPVPSAKSDSRGT
ncbi:hypothetical protein MtrunA17_Chr5g0419141 [Medicago truncatula]|uniref:Uncharacterized protein n=1 Tax=Medicago truncatula TaxID=3880 RepID=A0A396HQD1_MEDTR|nr:hypothetical protein MtrunA17_Chr5g0419141 [Medicago truncatula]